MRYSSTSVIAAATALFGMVNGHITMTSPQPFDWPVPGAQRSPMDASGSDFPCKMGAGGTYTIIGDRTNMPVGSTQSLAFEGSAVHGGGSCQVSLSRDLEPTPQSEWFVIHSIMGGCVARNQPLNLPDGSSTSDTYDFQIPQGVEPGDYTLAWTWFNKVGNPEMYMNCAPITVTGGGAKAKRDVSHRRQGFSKRQSAFPGMYIANVGPHGDGCSHGDWKASNGEPNLRFPNPGSSVEFANGESAQFADAPCGRESATGGASGGGSNNGGNNGGGFNDTPAPQPETPAPEPETPAPVTPQPETPAPEPETPAPVTPQPETPAPVTPPTGGSGGALSGACSPDGTWNCIGGSSFQQCASGAWSVAQQMAAGTVCTPGQSASLAMSAA